jgi:signal transduction histidine kinase
VSAVKTLGLVIAVACVGALGTLAVGLAMGMNRGELGHLALALAPVAFATVAAGLLASRLLSRASLHQRFIAVALVASAVTMANVAVLSMQMFVSDRDATLVTVLLVYAVATGVAAAIAIARTQRGALDRLERTAARLATGDLRARVGAVGGGPELEALGQTLDEMAGRLELALSNERAAEQMRRDLTIAVSHDLRTPLASLRAMVEALDDGMVSRPEEVRRYASEMRRSTTQLINLVDDLFELSRLDAGAIAAETRRVRLDQVVADALDAVGGEATRKQLSMHAELGDAFDAPCSPRLTRVLQNLLSNAVHHTPTDGTVRITASRHDTRLALVVEDTGAGIAPGDLPHVFEPFYRADPARSGPGAGLGLALAKRIVEALGGTIQVQDGRSVGARFAVAVPLG